MPETKPYRIWFATAPFRRDGTPVVGTMGSSLRRVVIIDGDEFRRLMNDHTEVFATVKFETGDLG